MQEWKLEPAHDLGLPLQERMRSLRREAGLIETIAHACWWSSMRGYLRLWHRLRVSGLEHLPAQPPVVIIANHCSHLDALVMASQMPRRWWDRTFSIAAGDVFFEKAAMAMFAAGVLNCLPMWRRRPGAQALKEMRARLLDERAAYILFPEGGRARNETMLPFKAGLGMLVAGTDVPVVPCRLEGCLRAMPPGAWLPRPRRIELRMGKPMIFQDMPDTREGWTTISRAAEDAVRGL